MPLVTGGAAKAVPPLSTGPASWHAPQELPLELQGHRIIARGAIEGGREVRILIDTGASCSVIDRRLASELGLRHIDLMTAVNVHGRLLGQSWVLVREIRLGPIATSRTCMTADLRRLGIQMIVGLDVLRRRNLTIDMQSEKLIFDSSLDAGPELPFDPDLPQIIIDAGLGGRKVRLMLDTGAEMLCLYAWRVGGRIPLPPRRARVDLNGMSGDFHGSEVYMPELTIGPDRWQNVSFLVIERAGPAAASEPEWRTPWDGILAPGPLGIRRIHMDFKQGLVKWSR
ncbi:MAG: hypothetical protein FJW35_08965 [Acidobacteria bacterium]|nr:hypothetical protein [Acidobacteriota bacterium]